MANKPVVMPPPQRWDRLLEPSMSDAAVQRVLSMSPFSEIDGSLFPAHMSLNDIIQNDAVIRTFHRGDLIVREGDYGSSAFFILTGYVDVVLSPSLPDKILGRREPKVIGWWQALSQLWGNSSITEERDVEKYSSSLQQAQGSSKYKHQISLTNIEEIQKSHETVRIGTGNMFGELAALSRTSRTASVFAEEDVEVLEIQWEGLRDIRNKSDSFRVFIDERYRERSLKHHLKESPLFNHISNDDIDIIACATSFETYGNFNWYAPFKSMLEKGDEDSSIKKEPEIAKEGHYVNGLILIRAGFARQSQLFNHGRRTLNYLGNGDVYGLYEIVKNQNSQGTIANKSSLTAMGYVDVLRIPTRVVEKYVLPGLPDDILQSILQTDILTKLEQGTLEGIGHDNGFLEFVVKNRFINGTQSMLIDMDRCTRCDDCVRACAVAHDDNPRFVRHGKRHDNIMVANSCMHCTDPVCMIGCPTGAIHRDLFKGQVVINDDSCIGCGSCATSCPYNNIRLVEIRDKKGNFIINEMTNSPIMKATKCDLCIDQKVSPACEQACPHDALIRMDMCDTEKMQAWLNR